MRSIIRSARQLIVFYLCFAVSILPAASRSGSDLSEMIKLPDSSDSMQKGSVYLYGDPSLDTLMPVRVLGAVGKAGVHFVPRGTDLLTLLSLAGGTTKEAESESITIRRETKGTVEVVPANLEHLVSVKSSTPMGLVSNDTIFVPQQKTTVSENTLRTVGFIAALATVFASLALGVASIKK